MAKKNGAVPRPYSANILDYPSTMSQYEKESLAAEAKLAAERRTKRQIKELEKLFSK